MWLNRTIDEAYDGLLQLIAAYVINDATRENYPALVKRGFTKEWAESMIQSIEDEGFREVAVDLILKNPGVLTNTHAGFTLSSAQGLGGCTIAELNQASRDLEIMLKHYGQGEGEDVGNEEGAKKLLMMAGHSETVARVTDMLSGSDFAMAQMRRMFSKEERDLDTYDWDNARFIRKEAFLGLRPWVYAGKVDESKPEMDAKGIDTILRAKNLNDTPTEGRWAIFG